jgi:hypothetical protein
MKRKIFILSAFSLIVLMSKAQEKPVTGYRFHSINSLGLVNGSNDVAALLQSVNGFQKKNWFLGIGAGLDYYMYRTVPVFADVRYSFGKKKNKFFAYADGGINISWVEDQASSEIVFWDGPIKTNEFSNGIYTDAGLGYLIKMKKENGLQLSLGYTHKSLKEENSYLDWRTQKTQTDINTYKLNRIVIKVGWQF